MIVNKKDEIVLTPEQKEKNFWDNWKFDSHRFNEYHQGYFECEYCGARFTSQMSLSYSKLCNKNPIILELLVEKQFISVIDEISPNWYKCYTEEDKKEHLLKIIESLKIK